MSKPINKIVILGTGNVASHLARAFKDAGLTIAQVYGRNTKNAREIAEEIFCDYTIDVNEIIPDADLYILAITESAVEELIGQIPGNDKLIVHTAGSIPMDILKDYSMNYGVFYPLQTFSKNDSMDYSDIPFCIEANSLKNLEILSELAEALSGDVRLISSEERKLIHLAAVFTCNFSNLLYTIADDILSAEGVEFDILLPLIKKTTDKIKTSRPKDVQTGPAKRKDMETISKHLTLLENNTRYKEIYKLLSQAIIDSNS